MQSKITLLEKSLEDQKLMINDFAKTFEFFDKQFKDTDKKSTLAGNKLAEIETSVNNLKNYVAVLDDHNRKENVIITNIDEKLSRPEMERKVESVVRTINRTTKISKVFRAGPPPEPSQRNPQRPRPVVAKLESEDEKYTLLRHAYKLKDTHPGVFIGEDLSPETIKDKKSKMDDFREKKKDFRVVYFRGSKLIYRGRLSDEERGRRQAITL